MCMGERENRRCSRGREEEPGGAGEEEEEEGVGKKEAQPPRSPSHGSQGSKGKAQGRGESEDRARLKKVGLEEVTEEEATDEEVTEEEGPRRGAEPARPPRTLAPPPL